MLSRQMPFAAVCGNTLQLHTSGANRCQARGCIRRFYVRQTQIKYIQMFRDEQIGRAAYVCLHKLVFQSSGTEVTDMGKAHIHLVTNEQRCFHTDIFVALDCPQARGCSKTYRAACAGVRRARGMRGTEYSCTDTAAHTWGLAHFAC